MVKRPKITPAEWEIMEAIWALGGSPSVRDIMEHAYPAGEKAYTTVQTTMNTLEKKGYLRRRKIGLVNFYTPTRSRDEVVRRELSVMVARIFDGSVPAVAGYLIKSSDIDLKEIETIKKLLEAKAEELREKKHD
jgi:BlaI family penicillinase repressor